MSIRKRKWKTPNGVQREGWVVDYVDQNGKRRSKSFDRKKDAENFETTARTEVRSGVHTVDIESITIGEAADRWLAACESAGLERTSIDSYRSHVELHIKPFLGGRKLSQFSVPNVSEFERGLRNGTDSQPARSASMVKRVRSDLGAIISNAQEEGLISRNVVREVRASRRRGKERQAELRAKRKLQVGVDIPTPQEIKAIVEKLPDLWRPIILTAIFTGLRASELRGLRWVNVDLNNRVLHVRERADEYNQLGRPKSGSGEREVPLPPIALNTLKNWKLRCPENKQGLVFPSPRGGGIVTRDYIAKRGLMPVQIAAGVSHETVGPDGKAIQRAKYPGLHSLRHFYASWCINRKLDGGLELPPKVVQERLGHSTITMTLDVYGHLFPRQDDSEELAAAEKALLG